MKNIGEEMKYKLVDGIKIPIWDESYDILLCNLRQELWAELYHKTTNQMLTMRNISSVVNTKLTKVVVDTFESKIDNVSYVVDFKVDLKLSYMRNVRNRISDIGKQIWYKVKSIKL